MLALIALCATAAAGWGLFHFGGWPCATIFLGYLLMTTIAAYARELQEDD